METKFPGHLIGVLVVSGLTVAFGQAPQGERASRSALPASASAGERVHWDLLAAPAAPAAASGHAEFQKPDPGVASNGSGKLIVEIQGLPPGNYQIMAVMQPDDAVVDLGQLSVRDPTVGPEEKAGEARKERVNPQQSEIIKSRIELGLSASVPATKIRRLKVSDTGGVVFLAGSANR